MPLQGRHGERSRLQLLSKYAGTANLLVLAVVVLAVKFWLLCSDLFPPPPSMLYQKCIIHFTYVTSTNIVQ